MTNQKQIRAAFWEAHPTANRKKYPARDWTREDKSRRDYCTDTRCAFVDFVDHLNRSQIISDQLASRATL
jgi:hypothetical protein|tara:strand:+ start:310 stop:519 length:210 start_codon:yes stop_codon:yes gene_type:complete